MAANPESAQQLLQTVHRHLAQQDLQHAARACRKLNERYPEVGEGWHAASVVALRMGGVEFALSAIDRALAQEPGPVQWRLQKIYCLNAGGQREDAIRLGAELAAELVADQSPTVDWRPVADLALLLGKLGQYEKAEALYLRAIKLDPGNHRLHFNLATVYRFFGDLAQAAHHCQIALDLHPDDYDAVFLRSDLARATEADNHVSSLRALAEGEIASPLARAQVQYALAKELEDLGEYADSFAALTVGAKARRSTLKYSVEADIEFIDKIMSVYDGAMLKSADRGCDSCEPIFVLGLPRTGTTLVERILGSHSMVHSAGELINLSQIISEFVGRQAGSARLSRPQMVALTAQLNFRALGQAYIDSTRPATGHTPHFVDKFPQNSLYIGVIQRALPRSAVVLLERHPMDTCYSMFKQLFTDIYQFSYNLEELGRYYIAHQKIVAHWISLLPEKIHRVRYESLVGDFENEVRALVNFCQLPWEDRCLEFQKNRQASTTASASQVRQGLYQTSVGRWRSYEKQLEPLRRMLMEAGINVD